MIFEWDARKADANRRKHRVTFEEASTVFLDPQAATYPDPDHTGGEQRYLTIGLSTRGRLLVVAHLELAEDHLRIVSARRATRRETHDYTQEG